MVVTGLFDIYALLFGIFGGIIAELVNGQPLGPFWGTLFANASTTDLWGSVLKTTIFGAIIAIVCCYKGMTASGGAEGVGRAVNEAVVISFLGDRRVQLRVHADAAGDASEHPGDQVMSELLAMPREWLATTGEIGKFTGSIVGDVWGLRVFRFFGEALRQAGILIVGSTVVIWSLVFLTGLGTCGIEAAYFNQSTGTPAYAGVFAAWCDLREAVPYAFGYMMAAKVGTGIVAELGAMRISEEIDALEVMGIDSMIFLCATRLLAAWIVLPFMYIGAIGVAYLGSYLGDRPAARVRLLGRLPADLLAVPERAGPAVQRDQGHVDGHGDRARRLLLRLQRQRRARRRRHGDGQVDGAQPRVRDADRHARNAGLLGRQSARADRRLAPSATLTAMSKTLVIAEKPSVGQDLARVLKGPFKKGEGWLEGPEHVITWAVGHLVQLAEPDEYDPNSSAGRWTTCRSSPSASSSSCATSARASRCRS